MNTAILSLALFAAPAVSASTSAPSAPSPSEVAASPEAAPTVEAKVEEASPSPMDQPAEEPETTQWQEGRELTEAPQVGIGGQPVPVHRPRLGMTLRGASVGPDGTYVHADAQSWSELVRSDPRLAEMHRLSRLREPGIVLTTLFGTWAVLSLTITADLGAAESHTGRFFAYGMPLVGLAAGIPMTVVGVKNRRRLHRAHLQMAAAPVITPDGAMLGVVGRF